MKNTKEIVYLNGEFLPQSEAKVSVLDRGFLFGDGVYEVVPVFNGLLLGVDEHLARLTRSLDAVRIPLPLPIHEWKNIFLELLKRNEKTQGDHNIYLQITRGTDTSRNHAIPDVITPTTLIICTPPKSTPRDKAAQGHAAITLDDSRRRDCCIKAINLLPNILLYEEAKRAGADEAILIRNGHALEGTSSNLFVIKNNQIYTPPLSNYILSGITRDLILKLARANKIICHEQPIPKEMLFESDEIWLTGSSKEIYAITKLDNTIIGNGKAGPMWHKMMDLYEAHKAKLASNNKNS